MDFPFFILLTYKGKSLRKCAYVYVSKRTRISTLPCDCFMYYLLGTKCIIIRTKKLVINNE